MITTKTYIIGMECTCKKYLVVIGWPTIETKKKLYYLDVSFFPSCTFLYNIQSEHGVNPGF